MRALTEKRLFQFKDPI